ncbi:uncharacterized protein LOC143558958 [Bidens hawaiensis]|uniref:uncharacterized protein LOC143558958 n=1 Tax=Bidens hawaiensis TaxID=980011 RepID=UPI004049010F
MKFEELIMQETQENQKTLALQQEVEQLEEELEDELKLSKVLQYALDGPCCPCLSTQTHLPYKIKELLTELATVEEEIKWLERKVHKLNLSLYIEKKQTREWELQQLKNLHRRHQRPRIKSHRRHQNRPKLINNNHGSQDYETQIRYMNQPFPDSEEGSDIAHKQVSCMSSKSFISKTSFNCTAPTFFFHDNGSNFDPYSILLDFDGAVRDIGPYKTFTQITRTTLDHTRISECSVEVGKLRVLMQKLCSVKLNLLTCKQKLAFWINIYNACIMHAFLQHGLPSTQEKLLVLMNKAVINVGGIVVNALAIEHFILRHPSNSNHGLEDEREILLRHAYGLGFPEPNVTFALCRGSWSSPALRVYTAENIVNELARARLEYLDASVGVISKKKIMVPKLLQWHLKDFADDMESLLEWIYSQLPQSGSLKRLIMECLNGETKANPAKMIEIQPYVYEFRYLLPS